MKKFILLAFICSTLPAFSDGLPDIPISTTSPMNEFQTMQYHKFEYEQEKNYEKEQSFFDKSKQKFQDLNENIKNVFTRNRTDSKIIEENGQFKIKYDTMEN
ncbi:hypothetical protein J6P92_07715 [bacterium]|nr:hypothetical protein [bacterium]